MTDNEKAATYIGWRPNQPCKCGLRNPMTGDQYDHYKDAPDMTKPENYMAAVRRKAVEDDLEFEFCRDGDTTTGKDAWYCHVSNLGSVIVEGKDENDLSLAILKALAALYDAGFGERKRP